MTPILGQTEDGEKITLTAPAILPKVVVYDVELTKSLPTRLSAASGLNAIAHAAEALYAAERQSNHQLVCSGRHRSVGPIVAADNVGSDG